MRVFILQHFPTVRAVKAIAVASNASDGVVGIAIL